MTEENTNSENENDDNIEDRKLTEEVKEKLSALRGFTSAEFFFFTPDIYKDNLPKDEWPVFKLKGRDGISIAKSEDDSGYYKTKTDRMYMTTGTSRIDLLRNNILGWKNYNDKNDKEIKFVKEGSRVSTDSLKKMSVDMQLEVQDAIIKHTQLTKEESEGLEF